MDSRNARYSQARVNAGRLLRAWRAFKDTPSIEQGVTLHVGEKGVSFERGTFAPTVNAVDHEGYGSTAVYWPATTITAVMMSLYIEADEDETVTIRQDDEGPSLILFTDTVNPIRASVFGMVRMAHTEESALISA